MRKSFSIIALIALLAATAFAVRGAVFAQEATPVVQETPVAEETPQMEATPDVVVDDTTTLVVIERATSDTFIDLGEEGESIGDLLAFANDVYDENNETQVGTDQGSCVLTVPGEAYECAWTLTLEDGQIMAQGPFLENAESVLAITGGTGAYVGVTGQLTVRALSEDENEFTYEFL